MHRFTSRQMGLKAKEKLQTDIIITYFNYFNFLDLHKRLHCIPCVVLLMCTSIIFLWSNRALWCCERTARSLQATSDTSS